MWEQGGIISEKFLPVDGIPVKPLKPNDPYSGPTAPLTSKVAFYIFIQQI
jgi:hypothetical protein